MVVAFAPVDEQFAAVHDDRRRPVRQAPPGAGHQGGAGAGLTKACGTGACAALVACARRGLTDRAATVVVDGGELVIDWRESDDHVLMTGPVQVETTGVLP